MSETFVSGAVVHVTKQDTGVDDPDSYQIDQVKLEPVLPPENIEAKDSNLLRKTIEWGFGPLKVSAEIDTARQEFGIDVSVLGIRLGNFYAPFDKGIVLSVNLVLIMGSLRFTVKDNTLYVRIDLDVRFNGNYHEDKKIVDW